MHDLKEEHAKAIAAALRDLKLSAAQMQTVSEKSAEFARAVEARLARGEAVADAWRGECAGAWCVATRW